VLSSRLLLLVLAVATASLLGGCASKRVYRQPPAATDTRQAAPRPEVGPPAATPPAAALELGLRVATLAREQIGRPYRWGGESPGEGFDCSGLVLWSYGCVGVGMPRVVREQQRRGRSIDGDRLRPGDLVFFATSGHGGSSHVGIYLGDGDFVHAPSSGQPVRTDSLDDAWWRQRWTDSRRVLGD
jgi:cell wall-associated NlpC family hydrolase